MEDQVNSCKEKQDRQSDQLVDVFFVDRLAFGS